MLWYNRRRCLIRLHEYLFVNRDAEAFFRLLDHKRTRIALTRKEILGFKIEGKLMTDQQEGIDELFDQLEMCPLNKREYFDLYQKESNHYISIRSKEKARHSLSMLKQAVEVNDNDKDMQGQYEQLELWYKVFIEKDTALIDDLLHMEEHAVDKQEKGFIQYLLARLYHSSGGREKTKLYIEKAADSLKDSRWKKTIDLARKDHSRLEL